MFISNIEITNFRTFKETTVVNFTEGVNILVGPNNVGKTTVISAIRLIFDRKIAPLTIDDFSKLSSKEELKKDAPKIVIKVKLQKSTDEGSNSDDLLAIKRWLTKFEPDLYQCEITMQFQLPDKYRKAYIDAVKDLNSVDAIWSELQGGFLPKYQKRYFVGESQRPLMDDSLKRFNCQYLPAIRNAEKRMHSGNSYLLNELLNFFLDYDLKSSSKLKKETIDQKIQERHQCFSKLSKPLLEALKQRFDEGKKQMLKYSEQTGAAFDGEEPDFSEALNDRNILKEVNLVVKNRGFDIPINLNGLGYNNLLYISLVLAELQQSRSTSYFGDNASIFPFLLIEEPEAHLHPDMQYDFLKFLRENIQDGENSETARQVIITTHSPNITAAANLDDLIVLSKYNGKVKIGYPGKTFSNKKDKKFVERFLDVTRSNLFFTDKIIFVEGLAEQMLFPQFIKMNKKHIQNQHVTVINLSGRYFIPFLHMFDTFGNPTNAIYKKVACVTDFDPILNKKTFPPILRHTLDSETLAKCKSGNNNIADIRKLNSSNIEVFTQDPNAGWTFEYQLMLENQEQSNLFDENYTSLKNISGLEELIQSKKDPDFTFSQFHNSFQSERVKKLINTLEKLLDDNKNKDKTLDKDCLISQFIATVFLWSIKDKGLYSQELAEKLENGVKDFHIPKYVEKCLKWIDK
ncbi:MAG: AAA family ATPase [Lentilactobacillus diolivorans]|nr:AAA family ATPase [Lentilactobacillus diolivorans]